MPRYRQVGFQTSKAVAAFLLLIMLQSCSPEMDRKAINPSGENPPGYSHAVVVTGGTRVVYVSGQVPVTQDGSVAGIREDGSIDLEAQTKQVFENLKTVLEASGASFDDVIKMTTLVVDYAPADIAIIRDVRKKYLTQELPPASTLAGVQALVNPLYRIEIEAVAVLR